MATEPAPALTVVPGPQMQKEIENTLDAPRGLALAIEELKKTRADAETELAQSLGKDLAAAALNADSAIEKHKAWKAKDEALATKIKTAEELRPIVNKRIDELKSRQPEALKAVLQRKIEQLEREADVEREQATLLKEQIEALKKLLSDLDKPGQPSAKAAK